MRILVWSAAFFPTIGGVQTLGDKLIQALHQRGHSLEVICHQYPPHLQPPAPTEEIRHGTPIHRIEFWRSLERSDLEEFAQTRQRVLEIKQRFQPDVIYLYDVWFEGIFHHLTARASPLPTLLTLHGDYQHLDLRRTIMGTLIKAADWITCPSASSLGTLRAQFPEITQNSSAILNSIQMPDVVHSPPPFDPPHILCIGRLVSQKGFDIALDAFHLLRQEFPGILLTIAGNGDLRQDLEQQTATLGLSAAVDFPGWVSPAKIGELINSATIVLVPSRYEPFGLVALEAARLGRPVVATRVGGLPEIVVDGETGFLVPAENPFALADAVKRLLLSPNKTIEMGQSARTHALTCFEWDKFVDNYEQLLMRVSEVRG